MSTILECAWNAIHVWDIVVPWVFFGEFTLNLIIVIPYLRVSGGFKIRKVSVEVIIGTHNVCEHYTNR